MEKLPIYFVSFLSQYKMNSTILRFQENYESPKFAGKVFDLEEFMDWYAETYGGFSYFTDWNGFNFPGTILDPFKAGQFDPLTRKEKAFLALFNEVPNKDFYIVAAKDGDPDTIRHEIAHGLYWLNFDYRVAVNAAIRTSRTKRFRSGLKAIGYAEHVMEDEINAYTLTGMTKYLKGVSIRVLKPKLVEIFESFFGFNIEKIDSAILGSMIEHFYFDPA